MRVRNDLGIVRRLLATEPVVAIVAPEFVAAFHPATPAQVEAGLERLGFYSVEETALGEELVATEYERELAHLNGDLFIRSTCPATVAWLEGYHPQLATHLAPIVSPMIAQGRLVRAIYSQPVKTVYIGPCIARKNEAEDPQVADAIDAVLTFDELKQFFAEQDVDVGQLETTGAEEHRPTVFKEASLIDGFPRDALASRSVLDTEIKVIRGSGRVSELAAAMGRGEIKPKIIDLLQCDGCIDGPAMATSMPIFARKKTVSDYYNGRRDTAPTHLRFADLRTRLPRIATARGFTSEPLVENLPSAEELTSILELAERNVPENRLDCGACGYDTCWEQALAISRGLAEWEMCFPFQRHVLLRAIDKLRELSVTDGLTGLVNHRTFNERLDEEVRRCRRYASPLSILMVDVDLFKQINYSLGHVIGDDVLKAVSMMISDSVRGTDIVARWGGDEFAVILPETDKTQAFAVAEKLRTKVEATPIRAIDDGNENVLKMTISIGVAAGDGDVTADEIVNEADRALYAAKAKGRNRTELGGAGAAPRPAEE